MRYAYVDGDRTPQIAIVPGISEPTSVAPFLVNGDLGSKYDTWMTLEHDPQTNLLWARYPDPLPQLPQWNELYFATLISPVFQHVDAVASSGQNNDVAIAFFKTSTALTKGSDIPDEVAIPAFQACLTQLFTLIPLTIEQAAEVRGLLDEYGFNAITLP